MASGFYSGSEAILMSIGKDRAKQLIEAGGNKGRALKFMIDRPSEMLTTILVGNNLVNIFIASLATAIAGRYYQDDAVGISVGITTLVILFFGEIIPKTLARNRAEEFSVWVIRILQLNYYLMYPIVELMSWMIGLMLGKNAQLNGRIVTNDDIEYMLNKAEKEKTIDSKQLDLLNSILEFPTIKVKDIMIPRSQIQFLDRSWGFDKVIKEAEQFNHSRYPVCNGDLDHIVGFLHIKDLAYIKIGERKHFKITKHLKDSFFVYEHMKIQAVFDHMNRKKVHLALVKDENGLLVGIITLEDIIEEILGEIEDEHDIEDSSNPHQIESLKSGILVEGNLSLRDLYNEYDIKIPLNDNYSTLTGFILDMLGNNFPEQGQMIVWQGLSFTLEKVKSFEIIQIKITDVDGEKHFFSKREAEEEGDQEVPLPQQVAK
ncbi:MAG: HlyC/CorC family transporter [Bdellovibrionales bacterium]|jgi:putative hemolysin|nr:HlyC/CorC family transporter [Bdellovibrionales bacterium]MBT3525848.1 HlyC/CorC family transporter [Bdellovibrionales bacterium]MBT7766417.1 HlyC/CorC family transporter [Bdellovibrionales bacterium]